jgi:thiol-disulfide isomerase/thioredoxin
MSDFNKINSIVSLDDLKDQKINENKDFIILFIYWKQCGACEMAIPTICDIVKNNINKNLNCKLIKVHSSDIKDENLRKIYSGGVPAFRILKKNKNNYDLYDIENLKKINNANYNYSTDGFAAVNYKDKNNNYLSTKNTIIDWINTLNKIKTKESYSNENLNNIVYRLNSPKIQYLKTKRYIEKDSDNGSGYSIMQLCDPYVKELNKSFNKIINEKLKHFNKY